MVEWRYWQNSLPKLGISGKWDSHDEVIRHFFNRDAEPKQYLDNTPISCKTLGEIYGLDGKRLQEQYAAHLSDFSSWKEADHAEDWLLFPENMGEYLSIDETSLSQGELYTILTNKSAKGRKGTLIATIKGTESDADGKLESLLFC